MNVITSFDGSWFCRRSSSTTGCMAAIGEKVGKILDGAMPGKHCNKCKVWKSKERLEKLMLAIYRFKYQAFPKLHDE